MRPAPALLAALLAAVILSGCFDDREDNVPAPQPAADAALVALWSGLAEARELRFDTDHGTIRMLLYEPLMPRTTARIGELVESGFYDDTLVHRVVDDFVIQGGDPSGTGLLGSGQTIDFERHPDLLFGSGAVGLARDVDPDSGDSQWFITERPAPHLSNPDSAAAATYGTFTLFAQVFEGMDVVRQIASVSTLPGADRPVEDVKVRAATLAAPPADLDLVQYPPTLVIRSAGSWQVEWMRPLHVLAGPAFDVTVVLEGDEGATPPQRVEAVYRQNDTVLRQPLAPLADDPFVFHGVHTIDAAGPWQLHMEVDGVAAKDETLHVRPWHDDYAPYHRVR